MQRIAERQRDARILAVISEVATLGGEPYQSATEGQIGYRKPVQEDTAPMLAAITRARRPQRMLEFGTAYGLSGLQLLRGNPDAKLVTIEFDQEVAERARGFFEQAGLGRQVEVIAGDSADAIEQLKARGETFDLVIMDHDKERYLPDFKAIESQLESGAVILADNVTDKADRCGDMADYAQSKYGGIVINTNAGLYMGFKA